MKLFASLAALLFLASTLAFWGCSGNPASYSHRSSGKVPTATLPANLPDPLIIEGLPTARPVTPAGDTYTVESGDTLSSIAEKLGTTVDELLSLNALESNDLFVGQVLKIPSESASAATPTPQSSSATPTRAPTRQSTPSSRTTPSGGENEYTVQSGDTANDIAIRFGITLDELATANGMTVDDLRSLSIGQVLTIPAPSGESEASTPQAEEATPTQ